MATTLSRSAVGGSLKNNLSSFALIEMAAGAQIMHPRGKSVHGQFSTKLTSAINSSAGWCEIA